jgi:two-component system, sensor histidine kinase
VSRASRDPGHAERDPDAPRERERPSELVRRAASAETAAAARLLEARLDASLGTKAQPFWPLGAQAALALLVVGALWSWVSVVRLGLWFGLLTISWVAAGRVAQGFRRSAASSSGLSSDEALVWEQRHVLTSTAVGLAWGLGLPLLRQQSASPAGVATLLVPAVAAVVAAALVLVAHGAIPKVVGAAPLGALFPGATFLLAAPQGRDERLAGGALLVALLGLTLAGSVLSRLVTSLLTERQATERALQQARDAQATDQRTRADDAKRLDELEAECARLEGLRNDADQARLEAEAATVEAEAARAQTALFFSAASHDLRQPLHALGLYAGLLVKETDEHQRRGLVKNVESCVDGLERLFRGILGIAEAEILRSQVEPTPVALMPLLDRVATRFRGEAEAKGLRLRIARTSLWAFTDPSALERILANLVSNAVRYTERGRVFVGIRRRGGDCVLLVGDTGVGISPRRQAKMFDALYQGGNPERDRAKGFGLGLAIADRLARALGTSIHVRSVVGRGTLFEVPLPRTDAQPESLAVSSDLVGPPSSLRVLLIEDDADVREATRRTLEGWNILVEVCATGSEAVTCLERAPLDRWHVLVDYRLGGEETGFEIIDQLRARAPRTVTISMITGEADATITAEAAAREVPVLVKPLKPMRLRALLGAR